MISFTKLNARRKFSLICSHNQNSCSLIKNPSIYIEKQRRNHHSRINPLQIEKHQLLWYFPIDKFISVDMNKEWTDDRTNSLWNQNFGEFGV